MSKQVLIGIDLGGTNIRVGLFNRELKLLGKKIVDTEAAGGPQHVLDRVAEASKAILGARKLGMHNVRAAGIGAPGPANIAEGIVMFAPNMPGFENVPIRKLLSERLGVPVVLENDANAACWGEFVAGVGKGVSDMALITLGTGIGGGIVSNGRLVHGFRDGGAEIGHMIIYPDGRPCACGQKGCVEAYASANSTAARATEALIKKKRFSSLSGILESGAAITCRDVYEHLAIGDELAKEITDGTAKALAILCVNLVHNSAPELIVFAGGVMAAGDVLLGRVKEYFDQLVWSSQKEPVRIVPASLGENAGLVGAAALAGELAS
jgi:glucokinase